LRLVSFGGYGLALAALALAALALAALALAALALAALALVGFGAVECPPKFTCFIILRSVKHFLTEIKITTQNHQSAHKFKYGTSKSHES